MMSVDQRSLDEALLAYAEAWNTPDAAKRRELLDIGLSDDCSYTDPAYEVRGKEELADHIGRSLSGEAYDGLGAGARIPLSSGLDQHHGVFRFSWVLVDPQGQPLLEGMDFSWNWQPTAASNASPASSERFRPYRRTGPNTWCGGAGNFASENSKVGAPLHPDFFRALYSPNCLEDVFSGTASEFLCEGVSMGLLLRCATGAKGHLAPVLTHKVTKY